jgi:trans-aconitate methyltransferase
MSLEAALQENTAVMRELIARLTAGSTTAVTMPASEYVATLDAAETKAEDLPITKRTDKAETKPAADATEVIDYEKEVRPVLVKVSTTKGRDPLIALLAQFKVTKGDQLKPAQFGDVIAAANELLAA